MLGLISSLQATVALQAALRWAARSGAAHTAGTRARAAARGVPNGAAITAAVPCRFSSGAAVIEARRPLPFVDFTPAPALMVATTVPTAVSLAMQQEDEDMEEEATEPAIATPTGRRPTTTTDTALGAAEDPGPLPSTAEQVLIDELIDLDDDFGTEWVAAVNDAIPATDATTQATRYQWCVRCEPGEKPKAWCLVCEKPFSLITRERRNPFGNFIQHHQNGNYPHDDQHITNGRKLGGQATARGVTEISILQARLHGLDTAAKSSFMVPVPTDALVFQPYSQHTNHQPH
eukprot:CAMPEP_0182558516 /NCGR_PEP_ID=MMETSP1324-20130603/2005_1 /TAXON_ID=236786 /ORGANISM="Florenciella sp., Strain RCC1587" /LENGTH=289 /DNA_ID=CAMNT_0024770691 /DNA_START=92 /DNA_END=961 /DNA_ORIENTATION=-